MFQLMFEMMCLIKFLRDRWGHWAFVSARWLFPRYTTTLTGIIVIGPLIPPFLAPIALTTLLNCSQFSRNDDLTPFINAKKQFNIALSFSQNFSQWFFFKFPIESINSISKLSAFSRWSNALSLICCFCHFNEYIIEKFLNPCMLNNDISISRMFFSHVVVVVVVLPMMESCIIESAEYLNDNYREMKLVEKKKKKRERTWTVQGEFDQGPVPKHRWLEAPFPDRLHPLSRASGAQCRCANTRSRASWKIVRDVAAKFPLRRRTGQFLCEWDAIFRCFFFSSLHRFRSLILGSNGEAIKNSPVSGGRGPTVRGVPGTFRGGPPCHRSAKILPEIERSSLSVYFPFFISRPLCAVCIYLNRKTPTVFGAYRAWCIKFSNASFDLPRKGVVRDDGFSIFFPFDAPR